MSRADRRRAQRTGVTRKVTETFMLPEEFSTYFRGLEILNGRGIKTTMEKITFQFDEAGRFDSFTTGCPTLAQAEQRLGLPLSQKSDHAFVYVKKNTVELAKVDGYVLFICQKRLFCGWVKWKKVHGNVMEPPVMGRPLEVPPEGLLGFLNGAQPRVSEDTSMEQMWWVQKAHGHGLLDEAYPSFDTGWGSPGLSGGRPTAFPKGAVLTGGSVLYAMP